MAVQVSYPGVYIEEFAPGAPIQGVSTGIPAFIGLAQRGMINQPEKITNWDQFVAMYGEQPVTGSYLWYGVRGFFDNGGQVCYVVRASNGTYSEGTINNREDEEGGTAEPLIRVQARQPGSTTLTVTLTEAHQLDPGTTGVYQPTGSLAADANGRTIELSSEDEAAQFRPGDVLNIGGVEPVVVRGRGVELTLDRNVTAASGTAVRLADLAAGARMLRILPTTTPAPGTLVPGSVLTISQNGTFDTRIVETVQTEHLPLASPLVTYRVTFREGLDVPLDMTNSASVESEEITVQVAQNGTGPTYANLGLDPAHPDYFVDVINREDAKVEMELVEPPPVATLPGSLPKAEPVSVSGGQNEQLANILPQNYIDALDALQEIDDVSLVAVPGVTQAVVQQAMIAHCEQLADRFAILDSRPGIDLFGDDGVEGQRRQVDSARGYAALYYPWLTIVSPRTGRNTAVPPSGHICGIMARTDQNRGVHKAPAGIEATVNGAIGIEQTMSDIEQGLLNLQNINVIRSFQGGRPIVWGARTTATDRNWQYVNIRRLFLYVEESIQEGIRWAVFEPNNLQLWNKLKRTITEFLSRVWRDGALFGATAEEAFYVRIDEALNPFSEQQLGRLHIEIGLRPSYPAEFIIVRIGIWPGGSEVSEG